MAPSYEFSLRAENTRCSTDPKSSGNVARLARLRHEAGRCPPISLGISPRAALFEEFLPRVFKLSRLRCRFLFDQYEFVAELLRLPSESRFEAFLTLGVTRCPKRPVVFDLLLHHRVEDDRELVRSRSEEHTSELQSP